MARVEVQNVQRAFGDHKAVDDVSITFEDGGFYALLGPSGSGKTTLLRMIAGFEFPDSGSIRIDGAAVETVPANKRRIGMVFQNYALFPHMSVAANVAFGLEVSGQKGKDVRRAVSEVLDLVQLGDFGKRRPHQLSGGQRQRVALARAIVTKPRVLLLDEPLSALDKALRTTMQGELKRIQREVGVTTIFVTHDQDEALSIADQIGILKDGRIVQSGAPEEIYDRPNSEFAATFLGDANILDGTVVEGRLRLDNGAVVALPLDSTQTSGRMRCAIRPERVRLAVRNAGGRAEPGATVVWGTVRRRLFSGSFSRYAVDCGGSELQAIAQRGATRDLAIGTEVELSWDRRDLIALS
ncbi:ABC transporter ATP-binding protein [Jiella sp. MQZ9-1]|uniref:Spermidine/putrescine import ATP-binding protein PotA n=1 Tax=Jiella flava TaxID=2816857 RepID=A0A939G049_9HYPH|nr:ABC transporter ATP-binding protein [Jiella flava]MBO0662594.1 ABC transporter ATP-binding protein [Jiella flava]MCD2472965.1 ABC transporter ATP-binding protein [Jiella flava]